MSAAAPNTAVRDMVVDPTQGLAVMPRYEPNSLAGRDCHPVAVSRALRSGAGSLTFTSSGIRPTTRLGARKSLVRRLYGASHAYGKSPGAIVSTSSPPAGTGFAR